MRAKFVVIKGPGQGSSMILDAEDRKITIGRGQKCGWTLVDSKISNTHCQIELQKKQFWLKDLDSTNGTYVNKKAVNEIALQNQDTINIGKIFIRCDIALGNADAAEQEYYTEITEVIEETEQPQQTEQLPAIDNYRIVQRLEREQWGDLYKAEHSLYKSLVVLKILSWDIDIEKPCKKNVIRKLHALKNIEHIRIVKFYDAFWKDEQLIIVSEYISGNTIREMVKRKKQLSVRRSLKIAAYIAGGLHYLHNRRFFHGSLLPEDILREEGTKHIKLSNAYLYSILEENDLPLPKIFSKQDIPNPFFYSGLKKGVSEDLYNLGRLLLFMVAGNYLIGEDLIEQLQITQKDLQKDFFKIIEKLVVTLEFSSAKQCYTEITKLLQQIQH